MKSGEWIVDVEAPVILLLTQLEFDGIYIVAEYMII